MYASAVSFEKLIHVLLGLYMCLITLLLVSTFDIEHCFLCSHRWEWFISLDFDWQYISRKKPFRWPLVSVLLHAERKLGLTSCRSFTF